MKAGCTFYFILVCGIVALASQLTGIFIPKVMVFETDRIGDVNISYDESTELEDSEENIEIHKIKSRQDHDITNFELNDKNETVYGYDIAKFVAERHFHRKRNVEKGFTNTVNGSNWNYTDGNEFEKNRRKEMSKDLVEEADCEDSSEEEESSESQDSDSSSEEEEDDDVATTDDGEKEEKKGDEDDDEAEGEDNKCEESSSSSEEEETDNSDELVDEVKHHRYDAISIGLWNSHICKRIDEDQQTCHTTPVLEAIRIVKKYVGYSQNEIDVSLWTHVQTESVLAILSCILGLIALAVSTRGYFRQREVVPHVFSIVGFISCGVLALVPVTRILMVTYDLLSNNKHREDRTLTLRIPWSVLAFIVCAVFSMIASFTLISVTWYSRKIKWRLLVKRKKVVDDEIATRLQDSNVAHVYADVAEIHHCDVHIGTDVHESTADDPNCAVHQDNDRQCENQSAEIVETEIIEIESVC